jgi:predicted MPP superfamily phosphohydrolase
LGVVDSLDAAVFIFILFGQWQFGRAMWAAVSRRYSARARAGLILAEALLIAGFVLGFSHVRALPPLSRQPLAVFSAFSYIWLFLSSAVYFLWRAYQLIKSTLFPPFDASRRSVMNAAGGAVMASPFIAAGYGAFIQRTDFRVREVDIPIPALPPDLEGLRLAQITDIHLSPFLSERELARAIDAANETRAHIALVTGDLISSHGDPLDACLRQVARLRPAGAIVGCMGNHERYAEAESYACEQGSRLGIRFLRQQALPLRFGSATLNIAGVDYQRIGDREHYLEGAERLALPGSVNILLSHNPDVIPTAARKGYDLTVAGHTHGGQVTIEILDQTLNPARFFTRFVYGLYPVEGAQKRAWGYVSRGIGTIGVPVRLGAPPEIAVLRLQKG